MQKPTDCFLALYPGHFHLAKHCHVSSSQEQADALDLPQGAVQNSMLVCRPLMAGEGVTSTMSVGMGGVQNRQYSTHIPMPLHSILTMDPEMEGAHPLMGLDGRHRNLSEGKALHGVDPPREGCVVMSIMLDTVPIVPSPASPPSKLDLRQGGGEMTAAELRDSNAFLLADVERVTGVEAAQVRKKGGKEEGNQTCSSFPCCLLACTLPA